MSSLRSLSSLFTRSDLVTIGVLVLLMVLSGLLEVFGIGMLFPYVAILQDPAKIAQSTYLSAIYRELGFKSDRSFSIAMSGGLLTVFLAKGFFFALDDQLSASFHLCQAMQSSAKVF